MKAVADASPANAGGTRAAQATPRVRLRRDPRRLLHLLRSPPGRFCCKSLFALVIKNFPGFRRDFRAKMWGTSSPDDKLADDLGNAIEGTRIRGRRSDFFNRRKISAGQFGTFATISA